MMRSKPPFKKPSWTSFVSCFRLFHGNPSCPQKTSYPHRRNTDFPIQSDSFVVWLSFDGGWTNPFEKYDRQIGSYPQVFGVKRKTCETTTQLFCCVGICFPSGEQWWDHQLLIPSLPIPRPWTVHWEGKTQDGKAGHCLFPGFLA